MEDGRDSSPATMSEHDRRVSALAALFGSDTDGHLRTNRNLTELWSQFDAQRRGALESDEFRGCVAFLASRHPEAPPLSHDDVSRLWQRLDVDDDVSPSGQVSVPSLVVFVRSALMAQWSHHRGTLDGSPPPAPPQPSARRRASPPRSVVRATPGSAGNRRPRTSSRIGDVSVRSSRRSPAKSAASSSSARARTPSPSRSTAGHSPGSSPATHRPVSPRGVGLYDVLRRARVRAAPEPDSLELGFLEAGNRVEVIESRNLRDGQKRVKVLFERGVVDWTGQRHVGWTSLKRPSGSTLLMAVTDRRHREAEAAAVTEASVRRARSVSPDVEAAMPDWVARLATPTPKKKPPVSRSSGSGSSCYRAPSASRASRARARSPSPLPTATDDTVVQAERAMAQLSLSRSSRASPSPRGSASKHSDHSSVSFAYHTADTSGLVAANAKLAVAVASPQSPLMTAGLEQAEMMIEEVRVDCARRVGDAEKGRASAEAEAAQLRRALRNAVDELQRSVTERENEDTAPNATTEEVEELEMALAAAGASNRELEQQIQQLQTSTAALQAGHAELEAEAAARPRVDVCGLWRASGIDADGQHIYEAFLLSADESGRVSLRRNLQPQL